MEMMEEVDWSLLQGEPIRPMRRVEFEKLAADGFFDEDERIELLFGVVVKMPGPDPEHSESTERVGDLLRDQLRDRARIRTQSPFAASEWSEPQPDVFVFPRGDYWHAHPESCHLVVEVSRSSSRRDRTIKAKLYALANVEEYWIIDHEHDQVEVLRDPKGGVWQSRTLHHRGETIAMLRFPDVTLAVADVLPPTDKSPPAGNGEPAEF